MSRNSTPRHLRKNPVTPPIRQIVCLSDTHGMHRKVIVPEGDLLICAGDFMRTGLSIEELADFNAWLGELPHPYKIVVAGNHDRMLEMDPAKARAQLTNAVYLENSGVALGGISFWGSPITPVLPDWAFHVERGPASRKYWDRVPLGTDVLITHGPPFGTLDKHQVLGSHFGCKDLIQAVLRVKPKLHVFGHVHGGYGQERGPNETRMVNCAVVDEAYVLANSPTVLSWEMGRPREQEKTMSDLEDDEDWNSADHGDEPRSKGNFGLDAQTQMDQLARSKADLDREEQVALARSSSTSEVPAITASPRLKINSQGLLVKAKTGRIITPEMVKQSSEDL